MIFRQYLLLLLALGFPALAQAKWADPSGFLSGERISEKEIYPGVRWISVSGKLEGNPLLVEIVAIDLTRSDLKLQTLPGARFLNEKSGQFVRRSTPSQLLNDNDALAAINVSFFDIGATQAFYGLHLHEGVVLSQPDSARTTFFYDPAGRAAISNLEWTAHVKIRSQKRPLTGVNSPSFGAESVMLFMPPWANSPGNKANFIKKEPVTEFIIDKTDFTRADKKSGRSRLTGKITDIRENKSSVPIKPDQFVLTVGKSAVSFFRNASIGNEIEVSWQITGLPSDFEWQNIHEAVSASPVLITNGKKHSGSSSFWTARHPRSAVGISRDDSQVMFLVVDGRSKESAGINLLDLVDFLDHMDAYQGMNFDGGGSSGIAGKINGKGKLLNHPNGGTERYVPIGVGVTLQAGEAELNRSRTWTGANGREMVGLFQEYNPASQDVSLILNGRRYTIPLSSLSEPDRNLILRTHPDP